MESVAPGILFFFFSSAVFLTIPASLILIWRYRRAIDQTMRTAATTVGPASFDVPRRSAAPLPRSSEQQSAQRFVRLRTAVVYAAAGAAAAVIWTALEFQTPDLKFTAVRGFAVFYVLCWPVVPSFVTLFALDRRRSLYLCVAYLVTGVLSVLVLAGISRIGNPEISPLQAARSFLGLLGAQALRPALIVFIVSRRRIRGVSPLVLVGLLFFVFSAASATTVILLQADRFLRNKQFLSVWYLSLLFMIVCVPVGYVCWRTLILVNALFQRKYFSDVQLLVDCYWLIVAFDLSAELFTALSWKGLLGLAGFVAYRTIVSLGLVLWRPPRISEMRLLVLRVFGFRRRTEKLFDSLVQRWRFLGAGRIIAGADLASRLIGPADTLALVGGKLRSRFVRGEADLAQQLGQMDDLQDPDSRFRVSEFFCHEDTWPKALTALLGNSDVVLMDLRGFSERNSGCVFEVQQLAQQYLLERTVFVIDAATDIHLLEFTVQEQNRSLPAVPELHLERLEADSAAEHERVFRTLRSLSDSAKSPPGMLG